MSELHAPFPYFGGKRSVVDAVWQRLGEPKQYIEPFCGSAAVLLAAPKPASLEVIGDANGFIANFWRATVHQSQEVARWADYPVSHIDLGARHSWLMAQRGRVAASMQDPDWPGDAKVAGWWLWGQCCWIGSGWCDWERQDSARQRRREGYPGERTDSDVTSAGMGIQASGKIPHVSDAGRGIQASGQIPHVGNADPCFWTSGGFTASVWLARLAARLERVRIVHGAWSRCLNSHYGGANTAVFLDPPYRAYEKLYGVATPVADEVCAWAREHTDLRVAICGHRGDYDLDGWEAMEWDRGRLTYAGKGTTDKECIWFSPACLKPKTVEQLKMFGGAA